jgi:TPR repeat protein
LGWYRKAAEQGNAIAQYNLGDMYRVGEGVPPDSTAAAGWYRKAAEQGYALAQNNLGVMYDNGEGVGQDDVSAYMWFNLAAANGFKEAVRNRNMVARHMTPEQVAEAQKLVREWKPK